MTTSPQAQDGDSSADDLVQLLASMADEPVPLALLTVPEAQGGSADEVARQVDRLADTGTVSIADDTVTLASDVRTATLRAMTADERGRALAAAAAKLRAAFPDDCHDVRMWPSCELLAGHARHVAASAEQTDIAHGDAVWLMTSLARYELARGRDAGARNLAERAQALADASLPDTDPLRAAVRATLGAALRSLDDHEAARSVLEDALELHEQLGDDEAAAADRVGLSVALEALGRLEDARRLADRAARTLERIDPGGREHIYALKSLGWIMSRQGEHAAAREHAERALDLAIDSYGLQHPETSGARSTLGIALQSAGDVARALTELRQAVEVHVATLGEGHPDVAVLRSNFAEALIANGEPKEARRQLELSLESAHRTLPPDHQALWIRHHKLASALSDLDDHAGARAHREQALAISEQTAGADRMRVARDLAAVASSRGADGDLAGARTAYERALEIVREADPGSAAAYARNLAAVLRALGDLPGALARYQEAIELRGTDGENGAHEQTADRLAVAELLSTLQDTAARAYETLERADLATAVRASARTAALAIVAEATASDDPALVIRAGGPAIAAGRAELASGAAARAAALIGDGARRSGALHRSLATLWHHVGRAYARRAAWQEAQHAFEQRLELLRQLPDPDPQMLGVTLHDLGSALRGQEKMEQAVELYRKAVDHKRRGDRPRDLAITLRAYARALEATGAREQAEEIYRDELAIVRRLPDPEPQWIGVALHDLANLDYAQGRLEESIGLYREAVEQKRQGRDQRDLAVTLAALGIALERNRQLEEAQESFKEAIAILRKFAAEEPATLATALWRLADLRTAQDPEEALPLYREVVEHLRRSGDPQALAAAHHRHAAALAAARRFPEAERAVREQLEILRRLPDPDPRQLAPTLHGLAEIELAQGKMSEAIPHYRQAVEQLRGVDAPGELALALRSLGRALERDGRDAEAEDAYGEQLKILQRLDDADPGDVGTALHDLGDTARRQGDLARAIERYREAILHKQRADAPRSLATTLQALGRTLAADGRHSEADDAYRSQLALLEPLDDVDAQIGTTLHDLGELRRSEGRPVDAIDFFRQAADRLQGADLSGERVVTLHALGRTLAAQGHHEDAEAAFREQLTLLRNVDDVPPQQLGVVLHDLADALLAQGRTAAAIEHYERAAEAKRSGDAPRDLAVTLEQLAMAYLMDERRAQARTVAAEAATLLDGTSRLAALMIQAQAVNDDPSTELELLVEARTALATAPSDDPLAPLAAVTLADLYEAAGQSGTSLALRRDAAEMLRDDGDTPAGADDAAAIAQYARVCAGAMQFAAAERALRRPGAASGAAPRELAEAWHYLGRSLSLANRQEQAAVVLEHALAAAGEADATRAERAIRFHLGDARRARGDLAAACACYRDAADDARENGAQGDRAGALLALARTLAADGETEAALATLDEQLAIVRGLTERDAHREGVTLHDVATLHARRRRDDEAIEAFDASIACKRPANRPQSLAVTLAANARSHQRTGARSAACAALDEAAALLRQAFGTATAAMSRREQLLLAPRAAVVDDDGETRRAATLADGLTPHAIALLERLRMPELDPDAASSHPAADELRREGFLTDDAVPRLTRLGRRCAQLLCVAGTPPAGLASWLDPAAGDEQPAAARAVVLSSRLALSGDASAAALLDGIEPETLGRAEHSPATAAALAVVSLCGDDGAMRDAAAHAARDALFALVDDADPAASLTLAGAAVDLGEIDRAAALLEHAAVADAGRIGQPSSAMAPQLALAWHRLGAAREARGLHTEARAAYEQSADMLGDRFLQARRAALHHVADMLEAHGTFAQSSERIRTLPWTPGYDEREVRIGTLLKIARLEELLGRRLAARAAAAQAGAELRLAWMRSGVPADDVAGEAETRRARRVRAADAGDALGALSPAGIALLERLRQDAVEADRLGVAPGSTLPPDAAWTAYHAAAELEAAGLVRPDVPAGWMSLTAGGRTAAAALAPSGGG